MVIQSRWVKSLAIISLVLLCGFGAAEARPLVIGAVRDKMPAFEISESLPFARHLAGLLRSEGITEGKVVIARSINQMADYLRTGKVDLFIDSSYPVALAAELADAKYLLRRWKSGNGEYRSLIFASAASGVKSLRDLKGKVVAFEERYSTSGYLLPKLSLEQTGIKVRELPNLDEPAAPGYASFVFSEDDETTMVWVLAGKVAAGAMDEKNLARYARKDVSKLVVLQKSPPYPRQVVCHRADLPASLVSKIRQALLGFDMNPEGKKVLYGFDKTTKFDELPPESIAALKALQKLLRTGSGAARQ